MKRLKLAMAAEQDGKLLKRDIAKQLRKISGPLATKQRASVRALPSKGHSGPSMRQAIARQVRVATRWSGRDVGISVIQRARAMPRDFNMAGRAFNREEGWNPTTLGGETVHQQAVPTGWFDNHTEGIKPEAAREVRTALQQMADRIASRAS
jgi:hypothetical protein